MGKRKSYFDKDMKELPFVVFSWQEASPHLDSLWDMPQKMMNMYFVLCTRGKAKYLIDSEIYEQDSSSLCIISQERIVQILETSSDFDALYFAFSPQFFKELQNFDYGLVERIYSVISWKLSAGEYETFLRIFQLGAIYSSRTNHSTLQHMRKVLTFLLFLELQNISRILHPEVNLNLGNKQMHYIRFIELVRTHLYTRHPVSFYLEQLNLSERYLNNVCREIANNSIRGVIDSMVALEIRKVLLSTRDPIQDIAERFNYPTLSYFIRFFKKMQGVTPAKFRKHWLDVPLEIVRMNKPKRKRKSTQDIE